MTPSGAILGVFRVVACIGVITWHTVLGAGGSNVLRSRQSSGGSGGLDLSRLVKICSKHAIILTFLIVAVFFVFMFLGNRGGPFLHFVFLLRWARILGM